MERFPKSINPDFVKQRIIGNQDERFISVLSCYKAGIIFKIKESTTFKIDAWFDLEEYEDIGNKDMLENFTDEDINKMIEELKKEFGEGQYLTPEQFKRFNKFYVHVNQYGDEETCIVKKRANFRFYWASSDGHDMTLRFQKNVLRKKIVKEINKFMAVDPRVNITINLGFGNWYFNEVVHDIIKELSDMGWKNVCKIPYQMNFINTDTITWTNISMNLPQ